MAAVLSLVMPFRGQGDIDFALRLATQIAVRELRANPWLPPLYKSDVRWKRDKCTAAMKAIPGACEPFKSPLQTYKDKEGDCDDVAPWRAAELIVYGRGRYPNAVAVSKRSPGIGYHVLVERGDGTTEDPSKRLGMVEEMRRMRDAKGRRRRRRKAGA